MHLAVRRFQAHSRTVAGQFIHGGGDGLRRQRGIQPLQRRAQWTKFQLTLADQIEARLVVAA
jgi:hypothetical protein